MFRILTRFHALYFGASFIRRNSIVWHRVVLARLEKRKWRISRNSYLLKTLISSEYGPTISGHVTVLRQWPMEENAYYIIKYVIHAGFRIISTFFSNSGMKYTCQFRSARSAFEVFENLHMDPLSFLTVRHKKVTFNHLIFILYQNCHVLATKYPFLSHYKPYIT